MVKLECVRCCVGCCEAEEVDSSCHRLCSYDGLYNADYMELLTCASGLRRIAACATGMYIFPYGSNFGYLHLMYI